MIIGDVDEIALQDSISPESMQSTEIQDTTRSRSKEHPASASSDWQQRAMPPHPLQSEVRRPSAPSQDRQELLELG